MSRWLLIIFIPGLALAQVDSGLPPGWFVSGAGASDYQVTMLASGVCGERAAQVTSSSDSPRGPVALMQTFRAEDYRGARVRVSATVDVREVVGWAGLFVRVDSASKQTLGFDDLRERPLRGRRSCARVFAVIDVPPEGEWLSFGVRTEGTGAVELSQVLFERVARDVELTSGSEGAVGSAWFTHSEIVGNVSPSQRVRLTLRAPGDWRSPQRDGEAHVDGEEVFVRMLSPDLLDGAFQVSHDGQTTTIEGHWGTPARSYPVKISLGENTLEMKWGLLERHLSRVGASDLKPGCRFYAEGTTRAGYVDQLELCGAVLSPTPPRVQTVVSFLMNGFRRAASKSAPPPRER